MALCPFATHKLLPESATQPKITARAVIMHSAAGRGSLYRFFLNSSSLESHFWVSEKGVIEPEFADTSGRGKRREFSERNVFEFAVALAVRELEVRVATTALLIRAMRSFMRAVSKAAPDFELPGSLARGKVAMGLYLYDGAFLVLSARGAPLRRALVLRAKLPERARSASPNVRVEKLDALPEQFQARLEIDLSEIASKVLK